MTTMAALLLMKATTPTLIDDTNDFIDDDTYASIEDDDHAYSGDDTRAFIEDDDVSVPRFATRGRPRGRRIIPNSSSE